MIPISIERLGHEIQELKIIDSGPGLRYRRRTPAILSARMDDVFITLHVIERETRSILWDVLSNREIVRLVKPGDFKIMHSHLGFVGFISKAEWEVTRNLYEEI